MFSQSLFLFPFKHVNSRNPRSYLADGTPEEVAKIVALYPQDPTLVRICYHHTFSYPWIWTQGAPFGTGSANELTYVQPSPHS
jgi:hypothetical protein